MQGHITMGTDGRTSAEEFDSWRSYWSFRREVARDWRYVRSAEGQRFLAAVAAGSHARSADKGAERIPFYFDGEPSPAKRVEAVWSHIARAFREPVTRDDDVASYAATQVIAEIFRAE